MNTSAKVAEIKDSIEYAEYVGFDSPYILVWMRELAFTSRLVCATESLARAHICARARVCDCDVRVRGKIH